MSSSNGMSGYEKSSLIQITSLIGAVALVVLTLITWGIVGSNNDHDFDVKCVQSGKSLTYITLEGQDYAKKVCK